MESAAIDQQRTATLAMAQRTKRPACGASTMARITATTANVAKSAVTRRQRVVVVSMTGVREEVTLSAFRVLRTCRSP
jgi:hypothetical protein